MKAPSISNLRTLLASALLIATLPACTTLPHFSRDNYVDAMDGAEVIENDTRYSRELTCLRPAIKAAPVHRFAVGRVNDFTGKEDLVNGKRITQGAALMVMSALAKAGVPMVERFDTSIADMELKYSDNKLITDDPSSGNYRKIFGGSIPGSDYHIVGGITEVNYNIKSGSIDSSIKFLGTSAQYFVMNVGVDLRLVNTKTLEVVDVQSLQKQIIGTELRAGYFRLFTDGVFDLNAAERTQEPIQKAVRMVIEQAVFNMVEDVYKISPAGCGNLGKLQVLDSQPVHESNARTAQTQAARPASTLPTSTAPTATPVPVTPVTAAPAKKPLEAQTPIELSTPPKADKTAGEKVVIDPNTGEIMYADDKTANMNGLVGAGVGAGTSGAESTSTDRMKEKMLWGSKPMIQ
ncbi:MAG TPA: CsgG/HfaB family protein [Limnobacter sp.]|uniref:CsgG/HfaB family protein n=1 Tax=Limnobacter sp. TaxID=2003368 RepID=UPI002E34F185|nr:CsgG/HfaB family protein [Limnobacter sp.]HEX5486589.1 CsgG/HfaB family protein [Limnobacter sp.]